MEACSCGLRRFFTNLYSLPSFLFLLAAASLLPSLAHTHKQKKLTFNLSIGWKDTFWLIGFILTTLMNF